MNLLEMWTQMGWFAKAIAYVLFFMSMLSFGVAIERIFTYIQARKQSKLFAPAGRQGPQGRPPEGRDRAGLQEGIPLQPPRQGRARGSAGVPVSQESGEKMSKEDTVDTVRRAIQRASALTGSDLKKMVSSLATIGATAPFVGLLGTVVGVINAFQGIATTGSGGIGAVSAGIAEALVETALGLLVAIPAVWFYNYLTSRIEYFNVEMDNSSSEMVDFFIKKS